MLDKLLEKLDKRSKAVLSISGVFVGAFTVATFFFITRVEADNNNSITANKIKKLDLDTSYNKAFRVESQISRIERHKSNRVLSNTENKKLKRLYKDIDLVDEHIYNIENAITDIK